MSFWQQMISDHFKLIIFFIMMMVFTGGGGYVANDAYINSAEFYGLVQSVIAQLPKIVKIFL